MKQILLLGATGSIGTSTLEVIEEEGHELVAFSFHQNLAEAIKILEKFKTVKAVACTSSKASELKVRYPNLVVYEGKDALVDLVKAFKEIVFLNAVVGYAGLKPTALAIERKYEVLIANKETLVVGGKLIMDLAKANQVKIIPVDSEHASVFSGIKNRKEDVEKLYITASGGSFRNKKREDLVNVTVKEALAHPNWSMGAKITIDSATMFNKCLEIIEAHYLFDLPLTKIESLLHDESLVHAAIRFKDGSNSLILTNNDMKIFISQAINYPNSKENSFSKVMFDEVLNLHLKPMDYERFPLVKLIYEIKNPHYYAVMNACNEAAVKLFLNEKITFLQIEDLIFEAVNKYQLKDEYTLDELIDLSNQVYEETLKNYWW